MRSEKRITMVPSGLIHHESMKAEMDKDLRKGLKNVTKIELP